MQDTYDHPWLDTQRFPGRGHLGATLRQHGLVPKNRGDLHDRVADLWSQQLGCAAADLVLAQDATQASWLVLGALLAAGDVALLAEPVPGDLLGGVLATGARYVDVGRRRRGEIDQAALQAAWQRHPAALLIGMAPSWWGTDDRSALATCAARARLVDARLGGPGAADFATASATLVTLPSTQAGTSLCGIVCAPGTGFSLDWLVASPPCTRSLEGALAQLQAGPETESPALDARYLALHEALAVRTDVRLGPRVGSSALALCLGGDAPAVASQLRAAFPGVQTFGAQGKRDLLRIDLATLVFDPPESSG